MTIQVFTCVLSDATHNHAVVLQQALQAGIPCPAEVSLRQTSSRLGQALLQSGTRHLPDINTVRAVIKLAWAASCGNLDLTSSTVEALKEKHSSGQANPDEDYAALTREALEVLTLSIALYPASMDQLNKDKSWHGFIVDLVLMAGEEKVRSAAAEQLLLIATRSTNDHNNVKFMVTLLFTVITVQVSTYLKLRYQIERREISHGVAKAPVY